MNTFSIFSTNWRKKLAQFGVGSSVGEVKSSMLTEGEFQAIHGTQWTLMDGKTVSGSDYHTLKGVVTIPDARGQFLRGKNNGRNDGHEDAAGERSLGNRQSDAIQGHKHAPQSQGAGEFIYNRGSSGTIAPNNAGTVWDRTPSPIGIPSEDGTNGVPRTTSETRSKNIAVNYFIKINW